MKQEFSFETEALRSKINSLLPAVNPKHPSPDGQGIIFFGHGDHLGLAAWNDALTASVFFEDQSKPRLNFSVNAQLLSRALNMARHKEAKLIVEKDDQGFMDIQMKSGSYKTKLPCFPVTVDISFDGLDSTAPLVIPGKDADTYWKFATGAVSSGNAARPALDCAALCNRSGLATIVSGNGYSFAHLSIDAEYPSDREVLMSPIVSKMLSSERGDITAHIHNDFRTYFRRGDIHLLAREQIDPYPNWVQLLQQIEARDVVCSFTVEKAELAAVAKAMQLFSESSYPKMDIHITKTKMQVSTQNAPGSTAAQDEVKVTGVSGSIKDVSFNPFSLLGVVDHWPYAEIDFKLRQSSTEGGFVAFLSSGDKPAEAFLTSII